MNDVPGFVTGHPALEGFGAFWRREIAGQMGELEQARRAALRKAVPIGIAAAVGAAATGVVHVLWPDQAWIPLAVTIALAVWVAQVATKAKQELKAFLAAKVCDFAGLDYAPHAPDFPLHWFKELALVPGYDRSEVEDYVSGHRGTVAINLADARLKRRVRSGKTRSYKTVFRGLLCGFSFPKRFRGRTVITGDKGAVLHWLEGLVRSEERVHLEDPRFESVFDVYATDQVEARYLLTPGFMERVLKLAERVGASRVRLAFDADHLLLALDVRRDSFDIGSLFRPAGDPKRVQMLLDDIAMVFDLVDTLGLDARTRV